ncbi:MAG: hypothetical protein COA66_10650 [Arcobacter sp.]|nr:MAG: hypothetical protein COA66_10650 [Arcobacter sp.]
MKIIESYNENKTSFSAIIERLMTYFNVSQSKDLSDLLEVNYATFSTWIRREKIPYELLIALCLKKGISLDWLLAGIKSDNLYGQENKDDNVVINSFVNKEHKHIDILAVEEHLKDKHYLSVSQNIIDRFAEGEKLDELKMVTVVGSSMSPTINNGDKVFISTFAADEELYNSIMYLVVYKNRTYIKRIQVNPVNKKVRLISDNDKYETFEIPVEDLGDFKVIGRVIFKCSFDDVI